MKTKIYQIILICIAFCLSISAQKIAKPTLTPTEATPAQKQMIQEGISLHDQKQYDQAISRYEQVLKENPTNDLALYEMAFSYYNKKDFPKAVELAYKLVQYRSNTGVLGYGLIANVLDDQGKPKEAVEIYQKAIKQLGNDAGLKSHLSSLHYNLGVTYVRQKLYKEARETLKKSVESDFKYASPNYLLAVVYQGTRYKVPALLAAARLVSLELDTQRAKQSAKIFMSTLESAKKDGQTGNINIFLDFDAPKDEGEFGMYDLVLGTLVTVKEEKDKNKTQGEVFADAVDTLIALLSEDKKLTSMFVGKTYIPYMTEMKKRGFSKPFSYLILQQNGNAEAEKWIAANNKQCLDFINWAATYQLKQ